MNFHAFITYFKVNYVTNKNTEQCAVLVKALQITLENVWPGIVQVTGTNRKGYDLCVNVANSIHITKNSHELSRQEIADPISNPRKTA